MEGPLSGRKVLVLAEDLYEELELWYPAFRLQEEGAEVIVAGPEAKEYKGKHGYPARAEADVRKLSAEDFDAVIIPGGYAPDHLRRHEAVLSLVRDAFHRGSVVAAICHGPWVAISAGIVKGKRATCYYSIRDDLTNAGAEYVDAEVVHDGNLITSRQPADLPEFCKEVIAALLRVPSRV
ncbi:MAG: DJ-1/PfpI/YhbO family deglycase/protease [Dehalococcoidia bacterium]|nr:DJ-1/PfpI/YhbO family deglycase/protease [Dehalococcoidia bacterium]